MEQGFWGRLKKPFFVLAPMADVTDAAFRRLIAKYGNPGALYTEFVSADGLFLADEVGRKKLEHDLIYSEDERPIVAQFFSSRPDMIFKAAAYAAERGFDGFDINMGCPDRSIEKQCAGAALIKNPKLAQELIVAAKEGIASTGKCIPVSVKTRLGYNSDVLEKWLPALLEAKPVAITIHARTRKDMSKVPARWERVKRAVEIRDALQSETLMLGNGDVADIEDAKQKAITTGADGIMLGRAIFGRPFLFSNSQEFENKNDPAVVRKILTIMAEHTKLFEELLGGVKNFAIMKKHYKAYVNGWDGAKELRVELMGAENAADVERIVEHYLEDAALGPVART